MCMHVLLYLCESNSTLHAGLLKRRLRSSTPQTYTYFQLESTLVSVPTLTTSLFFHTGHNWRRSDHHKRLYEGVIDSTNTYTDESEYGQNDSRCHQHYICTLHPDHWTLHLWCSPSVNQPQVLHLHTATTWAGDVVLQPLAWILLALVVVSPIATCAGVFFLPPTDAHTPLALEKLHCVVVVRDGGLYIYI